MSSSVRAVKRMGPAKLSIVGFVMVALLTALLMLTVGQGFAAPANPQDETKVPHYFGPWPNWALSPVTLPDVTVDITGGGGTGATADATVGANGAITGITVTNPGSGYTSAPTVAFTSGAGTGATAEAVVTLTGIVTGITVANPGSGYTAPTVVISGGGATTDATATAYGGVDAVAVTDPGSGYTFPTVDFDMPDDPNGTQATAHATIDANGAITGVVIDEPGSGYAAPPQVVIRNGTLNDPINNGAVTATASATLSISSVVVDSFGAGYTSVPTVDINDPTGTGAVAAAAVDSGGVTAINVLTGGSGYVTSGGIKKFVDGLPGLCDPATPGSCVPGSKYIPLAVPDMTNPYVTGTTAVSQSYEIAVVQYMTSFSSSLPPTLVRGYVQLETPDNADISQHWLVTNTMMDGTEVPVYKDDGVTQYLAVTPPQYLGPAIVTPKDQAVRIVFRNLLPTGMDGDLFLPVDSTIMGSGMGGMNDPYDPVPVPDGTVMDEARNPMCTDDRGMMGNMCFPKNRATLHLHGGNSPWISDGTPHQWVTPAGEQTMWPQGVSVKSVPDMNVCEAGDDGCMTFYYTNQQSARLMFYHDHSWGITRLNVYAGEAAPYVITDATEQALVSSGKIPGPEATIPLVVQDKTFVPQDEQLYDQYDGAGNRVSYGQDPTWDQARWGGYGSLWYHHVYMPAQNPGDPSGMSAYGRWMYSPWFWPPQDAKHPPIANPYYDPACNLDDPATWTYDTDPFCEPQLIPGTPNISAGMEQFNDTPLVNGVAYPTLTVEPKSYRLRILNAANDRFFNLQWYVGDVRTASTGTNAAGQPIGETEVALNPAELAAAQTDPVVFPTPDLANSPAGPDWVQFGNEGGFLPAPVVVDGQQVTTWVKDPTLFGVGNVDQHSLLLAPAERADVVVDFRQFAGKTLILYNDAPAAFPARIPSYDYYTGAPDLSPNGAAAILPGYGPNTRTVMQVKVAAAPVAPAAFNLQALRNAFSHKADGSGVFESSQPPIIVGQAAYNSAYGQSFAASGWCTSTTSPFKCDGYARINQQGGDLFTFDTLWMKVDGSYPAGKGKLAVKIEPKAIQDETSESVFDEFGRMSANLGVEIVPAIPGVANTVLHPYAFPGTEIIDTTGLPVADVKVTPITSATDGTQIWKITHNGVDTHPIHVHAYDVQVLNRVNWDNVIKPPDPAELGWKETLRVAPLEDTYFALRPIVPTLPFDLPNSIRLISPMNLDGAEMLLSSRADALGRPLAAFAPNGEPIDVFNHFVNFGAEYVYHCHILSHEEMDMMRPVSLAYPPIKPSGLTVSAPIGTGTDRHVDLAWTDNSHSETGWEVRRAGADGIWTTIATLPSDPANPNLAPDTGASIGTTITYSDIVAGTAESALSYRVRAINVVGDTWDYADPNLNQIPIGGGGFPTVTVRSGFSNEVTAQIPPDDPTALTATYQAATGNPTWMPPRIALSFTDNANNENGFVIERAVNGGAFAQLATLGVRAGTGAVTYTDTAYPGANGTVTGVAGSTTYQYRVYATGAGGTSGFSNTVSVTTPGYPAPPIPVNATAAVQNANSARVTLTWTDVANNTGYTVQRALSSAFVGAGTGLVTSNINQNNATSFNSGNIARNVNFYFRVRSFNATGASAWVNATPFPILTP